MVLHVLYVLGYSAYCWNHLLRLYFESTCISFSFFYLTFFLRFKNFGYNIPAQFKTIRFITNMLATLT